MLDQLMAMFQGGLDPALGATMANNPEAIAMQLASQGVPPPAMPTPEGPSAFGAETPLSVPMPTPRPELPGEIPQSAQPTMGPPSPMGMFQRLFGASPTTSPAASNIPFEGPTQGMLDQGPMPPSVDNPLAGPVPMPAARPSSTHFAGAGAPREGTPDAQAPEAQNGNLLNAFRGLKAPPAPVPQKISSPAAVRPNQLPANNNLVQLLAAALGNSSEVKPLLLGSLLGGARGR